MDSHMLEGLTLRLEAAERGLRGARRAMWIGSILVALAIGGAAWWFAGHMPAGVNQETVEAQHFVVRDKQGEACAVLETQGPGGTQLVFFRDPLPGDAWREHVGAGPFSFGVRSLHTRSQLILSDRNGAEFQLMAGSLSFGNRLVLVGDSVGSRIMLADSTGHMQMLTAAMIADAIAKRSAKTSPPPRNRRRR